MLEIADHDPICGDDVNIEDWFGPRINPLWTEHNFRGMLAGMWEAPQADAKVRRNLAAKVFAAYFLNSWSDVLEHEQRISTVEWANRGETTDAQTRTGWLVAEINDVARESSVVNVVPVDERTKLMAIEFANSLPDELPAPEIGFDPDGEVSFDWLGPSNKIFSVSVDRTGRLAYAGRFAEKRKINGVEQVSATCPAEIVLGIERVAG